MSKLYIYNGNNREELNISEDTEEEFNDIETDFEDEIEDIMNSMLNNCDLLIQLYFNNSQLNIYKKILLLLKCLRSWQQREHYRQCPLLLLLIC